ncbi:hypothetical protein GOODEAATRI_006449 [Goodea atripinnis]|uniref:Uncharacterized protein n=1 Tax=Goodea atripinnis TaxID=208336 RepID=A0ABV0MZ52_9TELE
MLKRYFLYYTIIVMNLASSFKSTVVRAYSRQTQWRLVPQSSIFTTGYAYTVSHNKLLGGKESPHQTVLYVTQCSEQPVTSKSSVTATLCPTLTGVGPIFVTSVVQGPFNSTIFYFSYSKATRQITSASSSDDAMAESMENVGFVTGNVGNWFARL